MPMLTVHIYTLQYLQWPPLFFSTIRMRCGIVATKLRYSSWEIVVVHTSWIISFRCCKPVGRRKETFLFMICHRFSMGFKSRLYPGHIITSTLAPCSHCLTKRAVWQGAPLCWNFVTPRRCINATRWFWRTARYVTAHIVVLGGRN